MREEHFYQTRLVTATILTIAVFCIGVLGYHLIEGWNLLDSLYMTVITLATIGYGEIHPLSSYGRIFTIMLILSGLGIMGYGLGITATFIVEGELGRLIRRRRMEKKIEKLENHFIVCGIGETGRSVVHEFIKTKTPFVIIESDSHRLDQLREDYDFSFVVGDATKDATLLAAGIERAQGLVSALHNDKDNLFVVLTARALNSRLRIVARVVDVESERKMIAAGANNVVSPNMIGGMRMASIMIRPAVVSFLDIMLSQQDITLRLEEVRLPSGSKLIGHSLRDADIGRQTGLIVVAIKKHAGQYVYNPRSDTPLEVDDTLIVMGDVEKVRELHKIVGSATTLKALSN
ncbi:MAG: potassium channel protein [Acidobacteriota bacterium]